jgi:HlyD family secretion protein
LQKAQTQLDGLKANQATSRATQNQNLESAQANFENAQRDAQTAATNLASTKRLFEVGGISQQGLNDAQNNHARAQNSLATAGVALNTARQNLGLKSTSDAQDLKNAQLAVQQAQISLKNAQADLSKTKIYAPFDGVVSVVSGTVGALSGQTALLTLVDDAKVEIPVQVDETEIGKIALGMPAEVSLDALGTEKFSGQVSRISPSAIIQQNIAVFYVTVTLDNPERTLRPGMTAEAEIIAEEVQGALLLPKRAVEQVRNRGYVMLQQPDGSSERVRVRVGPDDGTSIVIESGLEPGQTVVLPTRQRTGTGVTGGGQ